MREYLEVLQVKAAAVYAKAQLRCICSITKQMPLAIETFMTEPFSPSMSQYEPKISVNDVLFSCICINTSVLKEDKYFHYKFDHSHSSQQEV